MKFLDYREQRPGQFVRNRPAHIGCNLTRKIGVAALLRPLVAPVDNPTADWHPLSIQPE
jgi:hypothetical protein